LMTAKKCNIGTGRTAFNVLDAHLVLVLRPHVNPKQTQNVWYVGQDMIIPTPADMKAASSVTSIRIASLAIRNKSKLAPFSLDLSATGARMEIILIL